MKPRIWLLSTITITLLAGAIVAALNAAVDIYGIFRDPRGRHLPVYGDERIAKYLLSSRYVPENFEGIVVGSSVSANWNMANVGGARFYNESLNGGNAVEEKALVDEALSRPGIRYAIVVVHPFLTSGHDFETVRLTPREKFSALGSMSLLDAYKEMLFIRLHRERQLFDDSGTDDFVAPKRLNARLSAMLRPGVDFDVDPIALKAYRDIVAELHAHGVRLLFVVPPISEPLLDAQRSAFAKYSDLFRQDMRPDDRLVDFTSAEFLAFRTAPHFADGVHLEHAAAEDFMRILAGRISETLGPSRQLARNSE